MRISSWLSLQPQAATITLADFSAEPKLRITFSDRVDPAVSKSQLYAWNTNYDAFRGIGGKQAIAIPTFFHL
jgi:hypothetical protein